MLKWHDYDIRVWHDEDFNIDCYNLLSFVQSEGASYLQVNDESKREDIRKACLDVANAMRTLDALVGGEE